MGSVTLIGLLLSLIHALDGAYKSIIGIFWYDAIYYGLSPKFVYFSPMINSGGYTNLESAIFSGSFFQISMIIMVISISAGLAYNSFIKPQSMSLVLLRGLFSIVFGAVSFYAIAFIMAGLGALFTMVFNASNINWYNFGNFSGGYFGYNAGSLNNGGYSQILEFLTLSAYFMATAGLFATLMIRQALILFCIILAPFFTLFYALNVGARYAKIIWEIIIEMSFYPFLVLLALYLAWLFSWDSPLQLAFLFLPVIIPGVLFFSGRGLRNAPMLSFLGDATLGNVSGKGMLFAGTGYDALRGNITSEGLRNIAVSPVSESPPRITPRPHNSNNTGLPWKEILDEELKYRKE